ncbi:hypothetical protein NA56DRAFT_691016 [Hyaloscypha hepaticicola]|uniref:Cora-domain-containing protein n=1 Tax=Hyaloscypha hepaticicola TaxID=2082293 RepID=A0A2J6PWZ7_9HELO|nr:hypothetical protein NA56DRAFT_691016 [Hyaloscypha hepaticicola]
MGLFYGYPENPGWAVGNAWRVGSDPDPDPELGPAIEYKLEREEPSFLDLELYLKELYIHRRRITRYLELISETKDQCVKRGPRAWPQDPTSELGVEQARDWEDDFGNLQAWFNATSQRMEKNIRLLTALVAIGDGKQSLTENHGIARLSLLAMVFLPFSSVATILGIQGSFAPGEGKFWLFWVVAIILTTFVVVSEITIFGHGKAKVREDEEKCGNVDEEHELCRVNY